MNKEQAINQILDELKRWLKRFPDQEMTIKQKDGCITVTRHTIEIKKLD